MEVPSVRHIINNCLIFSVISTIVIAQIPQRNTSPNPCPSKEKCHECIQTPLCAWCSDPEYKSTTRCFQPASLSDANVKCDEKFLINPKNDMGIILAEALSEAQHVSGSGGTLETGYTGSYNNTEHWSANGSSTAYAGGEDCTGCRHIVQISPQRLNLKLRARQSYSVYMNYTQAEDYPLDLYYLMDLSRSMLDDKEKLSSLGDQLAITMRKLTSNFRLGFGSFVDKVVMPYVSTLPQKLRRPCDNCVAPYGFRHHMTLSNNTHMFSHMVKEANVSGNLDAPEGGFDAIMQAVECRSQIGWRAKTRSLLVFSTDASFHYAGDGKLGGIVKPNDGLCHLSGEGFYSESSYQDYPSIEQINLSAKKYKINIIFAVTKDTFSVYEELAKNIEGASASKLEDDSSNIVELIKNQYEQISSSVEMKHNASSAVSVKFFTRCRNDSGVLVNTNKCGNIKVGDIINFRIDIELLKCPKDRKDHFQTIKIHPVGIDESLIIDLEMLCECDCEKPGDKYYKENSPFCSGQGTYKCGICECNKNAFGALCQCTSEQLAGNTSQMNCINPKGPPGLDCSGKGQCVCGTCACETRSNPNEKIYGPYCECDNFSCERHDGKLCSGPDHGTCDCGTCQCKKDWTGPNCACTKSNATCYSPRVNNGTICSGNGECQCGVCVCKETEEGRFKGVYCEKCPKCESSDRCKDFDNCVLCQQYKTGPLTPEECRNCTFVPIPVQVAKADEENGEVMCTYTDEEDCRFAYVYLYDAQNKLIVRAQEERKCPPPVHVPVIVLGVIAAVLLTGMATLLFWKLLTSIHDKREFARFEKEKMMARWDTGENPIYKQATSTFKNPTYAGKG